MTAPATPSGAALDALREQNADARTWVVWSFEHDCWWAGNHSGYTSSLLSAGLYTEAEAKEIARPRRKGRPDEEARPLAVALADEATKWHGPKVVEHVLALLTEHTALRAERDKLREAVVSTAAVYKSEKDGRKQAEAQVAALSTRLAVAGEELAAARKALAEAETPDIMGDDDGVGYFEDDYDCLVEGYATGTIREVWANKQLGQRWIARIPTAFDEDGDPDDFETRVFESRAEAEAAVATAARRSPTTRGTGA